MHLASWLRGNLSAESISRMLSKSGVDEVWDTGPLSSVEVTSSTTFSARRTSWANARIAPAKRKALSPRIRKGRAWLTTS